MRERSLAATIETVIAKQTGRVATIAGSQSVGGGCISEAQTITLDDGRRFFVKTNTQPLPGMFACEAAGLAALEATGTIRVPSVVGVAEGPHPLIVMEQVETGAKGKGFFEAFGRELARMHQLGKGERFGFDRDNYIGSTVQQNGWHDDWPSFFAQRRLSFQLDLARRQGLATCELLRLGDLLVGRIEELLAGAAEPPTLLHGDLWGGNYLCDSAGRAALIDPAVYYGHREAELAMTTLFGGFSPEFYAAYDEQWPLAAGSDERMAIYSLYHLLNHLNLFGSSYLGQCIGVMRRFC